MRVSSLDQIMLQVAVRNPGETEFHQAVREVFSSVLPVVEANPLYSQMKILERIVEPERSLIFRVPWVDDLGNVQVNRGFRVQMNSAIGPYQGGVRFHPNVNLSIMKFLAFGQVFRNSLTCLPLGGAKGGSDFDPKGKSDMEVMRFCQSYMSELFRHIGPEVDILTSGLGVGGREIGYLYGMHKKLSSSFTGVMTNKGLNWGGSLLRPESSGFGVLYFVENMLAHQKRSIKGMRVAISGSGNVAQYAAKKAVEMGAIVTTMSDSNGTIYDPAGFDEEKIAWIMHLKNVMRGRIQEYADKFKGSVYYEDETPWHIPCHIAIPAAAQNEIYLEDAQNLVDNGLLLMAEAADMPCLPEALDLFRSKGVLYGPGKAVNAGGAAASGLEMAQNASHQNWTLEEVDERLKRIVRSIHDACVRYGKEKDGTVDYRKGADVAAFLKVADAMIDQGVI